MNEVNEVNITHTRTNLIIALPTPMLLRPRYPGHHRETISHPSLIYSILIRTRKKNDADTNKKEHQNHMKIQSINLDF